MRIPERNLKALALYRRFRANGYDSPQLYLRLAPGWFLSLIGCALSYWLAEYHGYALGWVAIGYFAGIVLARIQQVWAFGKFWPAYEHIVNWERVDELLEENNFKQR